MSAGRSTRLTAALLRLYPWAWRVRYGDEMRAVLDARGAGSRDRIDLVRGALDAHLHPARPSIVPGVAAVTAGACWILVASAVLAEPVPPDWPGYFAWTLPLGVLAAATTTVATLAVGARDPGIRAPLAVPIAVVLAVWVVALAVAAAGGPYGPVTGATQALAGLATIAVGFARVRLPDQPIGEGLVIAGAALLLPPPAGWLVAGAVWSAIGLALLARRATSEPPTGPW